MAVCKYCASGIEWEKDEDEGKWRALNEDGSRHYCDRRGAAPRAPKKAPTYIRRAEAPLVQAAYDMGAQVGLPNGFTKGGAQSEYREYTVANPPEFPRHDTQADILDCLHRIEALLERLVEAMDTPSS